MLQQILAVLFEKKSSKIRLPPNLKLPAHVHEKIIGVEAVFYVSISCSLR